MKSFFDIYKINYFSNNLLIVFILFCIITPIISFIYNINLSNIFGAITFNDFLISNDIRAKSGGTVSDLETHWNYILKLKDNFTNLLSIRMGGDEDEGSKLLNFPLHHIIFSQLLFFDDIKKYLLFFFIFSFFLPLIFYKVLKIRFPKIKNSKIIYLCSIILILPSFQYSSIWGSNHITALIFLSLGFLFYNNFKLTKKIGYLFVSLFFFSLCCYTKQYYVFIFPFLIISIYERLILKKFFIILSFISILGLPGLFFVIKNPLLITGISQKTTNFSSSILVSSSIIFFYLVPFIITNFLNLDGNIKSKIKENINLKYLTISLLVFFLTFYNFEYNSIVGGGIFLKISKLILQNYFLFYLFSFLGIYYLLYFSKKNFEGKCLVILLLITFSSGYFIFQKYFEIMFYMLFLNFFDKEKILRVIKNNGIIIISYFTIYYGSLNYIYFFGL